MKIDVPVQNGLKENVDDFLFNPKWEKHREKIKNHNFRKTGAHIAKISKNGLKLRSMLLAYNLDIFPVIFRTYEKNDGSGLWSWEVLDDSMKNFGSWIPLKEIIKGNYVTLVSDEVFPESK